MLSLILASPPVSPQKPREGVVSVERYNHNHPLWTSGGKNGDPLETLGGGNDDFSNGTGNMATACGWGVTRIVGTPSRNARSRTARAQDDLLPGRAPYFWVLALFLDG